MEGRGQQSVHPPGTGSEAVVPLPGRARRRPSGPAPHPGARAAHRPLPQEAVLRHPHSPSCRAVPRRASALNFTLESRQRPGDAQASLTGIAFFTCLKQKPGASFYPPPSQVHPTSAGLTAAPASQQLRRKDSELPRLLPPPPPRPVAGHATFPAPPLPPVSTLLTDALPTSLQCVINAEVRALHVFAKNICTEIKSLLLEAL